jgi:hypothetical protein
MSETVNDEGTHPANSFSAIVIKGNGFDPLFEQLLVELIQHLEKRRILGDFVNLVRLEPP